MNFKVKRIFCIKGGITRNDPVLFACKRASEIHSIKNEDLFVFSLGTSTYIDE